MGISADGSAVKDFLAMYNPKSAAKLNASTKKFVPEIAKSKYGSFPMKLATWLLLDGSTEDSQPAFIPAEGEVEYCDDAN
jgi:hypothetical protein